MHPSPVLLDFRLTVLYHGLKATQYFSKFTEESISVLKEDLLTLGLPHPRKENITLLSHGLVECFWPSARKNHVLHQNLIAKTQQTPTFEELTRKLSISSVRLKERPAAEPSNVDLDKPKNLKRSYSRFEKQGSISASSDDLSNARVKARGTANFDARSPAFHARPAYMDSGLRTNDSVAGPSRSIPVRRNDDDFSRPGKVAKIHSQGFQISPRRDPPREYPSDRRRLFDNRFKEPSVPASIPTPTSAHTKPDHTKATSEKTPDANPGVSSRQKSLVGEKVKVEERVVDEFLNNLNLHPSAAIEEGTSSGPSSSAPNLKTTEAQINILLDVHNLRRLSTNISSALVTAQHKDPSIAKNSDDFGDIPGLNAAKLRMMQTATSVGTLPTPPPSAPFLVPPIEGRSRSAALPLSPAHPLAKPLQNKEGDPFSYAPTAMNRSTSIGIGGESKAPRSDDDLEQELLGRYGRSYKELCYVKEEIAKLMKREEEINEERTRIRNLIAPKIGQFEDEEGIGDQHPGINGNMKNAELEAMRTRLDEMHKECASERLARTTESQKLEEERKLRQEETRLLNEERKLRLEERKVLDEERRRRDEAENALADVRRECRQPFVVPSLLDTFVELSKLTTRGLKVSAAPPAAARTSSFSESWGSQDRGSHNFSRPITNNRYRDIPTVDDKDKTREHQRQARIKAEPMTF